MTKKPLGRDAFFGVLELNRKQVEVPELGGSVTLRELSSADMYRIHQKTWRGKGKDRHQDFTNMREHMIIASAEGPDGLPLFTDDDAPALARLPFRVLDRLVGAINDLNGIDDDDTDERIAELESDPLES